MRNDVNRNIRGKRVSWSRKSRAAAARLLLASMASLSITSAFPRIVMAADAAPTNWAFTNDGSLQYEDNASSWYSDRETVHAVAGIDVNVDSVRQNLDIFTGECVVALIDTGVDITHPALLGGIWSNPGEIAGDGIDNDGNGYVDDVNGWNFYKDTNVMYNSRSSTEDAHGTHCAGTIVANGGDSGMVGIAGGIGAIRLMPIKTVGGTSQTGSVANLIKSIQYAEQNGAKVCNISLALKNRSEELYQVMKESDMLFVTVAGNGGSDTRGSGCDLGESPMYPACYDLDNVLVVSNLKCDGTLHYSSNYSGVYVDLAAPGTKITSTSTCGAGYEEMTGTSMSAPMVSAAAALVFASHEGWDALQVKHAILASCRKLDTLPGLVETGGMLDVAGAVAYAGMPSTETGGEPETPSTETGGEPETPSTETGGEPETPSTETGGEPETPFTETGGEPDAPSPGTGGEAEAPSTETGGEPETPSPGTGGESGEVRVPEPTETLKPAITLTGTNITGMESRIKNQLTVRWKNVKGADGYELIYASNKAFTKNRAVRKTAKTSLTLKNLDENKTWYIKVRAYAKEGAKTYSGTYSEARSIKLSARPPKVKKVEVKPGKGKLSVTAGKVKGADGYVVTLSAGRAGQKIVAQKKITKGKASFLGLQRKKTYYVTIRAYREAQGGILYGAKKDVRVKTS